MITDNASSWWARVSASAAAGALSWRLVSTDASLLGARAQWSTQVLRAFPHLYLTGVLYMGDWTLSHCRPSIQWQHGVDTVSHAMLFTYWMAEFMLPSQDNKPFSFFRPNRAIDRSDRFGLLVWARRPAGRISSRRFASNRVLKRLNVGWCKQRRTIAQGL